MLRSGHVLGHPRGRTVPLDLSRIAAPSTVDEPETELPAYTAEELPGLLDRLQEVSPLEADIVDLTLRGIRQCEIGRILGLTQMAVSYRLRRALERLAWIRGTGSWFDQASVESVLQAAGWPPRAIRTMGLLWRTTCMAQVRQIECPWVHAPPASARMKRLLERLQNLDATGGPEQLQRLQKAFRELSTSWNILHVVETGIRGPRPHMVGQPVRQARSPRRQGGRYETLGHVRLHFRRP